MPTANTSALYTSKSISDFPFLIALSCSGDKRCVSSYILEAITVKKALCLLSKFMDEIVLGKRFNMYILM